MLINQYHGVNPQLNDWLVTTPDAWPEFHQLYIDEMMMQMREQLKERGLPYTASTRPGLQIRTLEDDGSGNVSRPEPDVAIYRQPTPADRKPQRVAPAPVSPAASRVEEISLEDSLGEDKRRLKRIGIFAEQRVGAPGEPVAWIEVLSPTNKPAVPGMPNWGRHADSYQKKRVDEVLAAGQVLVEVDLLQAQPPVYKGFPRYQPGPGGELSEAGSLPYSIAVTDPRQRPGYQKGSMRRHPFRVEDSLPRDITIPLLGDDTFKFDFDSPYDVIVSRAYGDEIDYAQHPALWRTYSSEDQDRIAARTITVLRGMRQGLVHSEQGSPLPLDIPLEKARFHLDEELSLARGNGRPGFEIER